MTFKLAAQCMLGDRATAAAARGDWTWARLWRRAYELDAHVSPSHLMVVLDYLGADEDTVAEALGSALCVSVALPCAYETPR